MSLVERVLSFAFSGAASGNFSASGLRAVASVQGSNGRLGSNAQVKIWGLSLARMNQYSARISAGLNSGIGADMPVTLFNLVITAGDLSGQASEVFNGNLWSSYVDLNGAPDSAFVASAAGIYTAASPIAAQSKPGSQNAETLIQNICATAGFTLVNNGAHAVLRNPSTYGSALDQIERIAQAAGFAWSWSGKVFTIWPVDGTVDSTTIDLGPATDPVMVGFPQYYETGIIVTSLFNPEIKLGRQMNIVGSLLTKANGPWQIVGVQHELSTMLSHGPWFTYAKLAPLVMPS